MASCAFGGFTETQRAERSFERHVRPSQGTVLSRAKTEFIPLGLVFFFAQFHQMVAGCELHRRHRTVLPYRADQFAIHENLGARQCARKMQLGDLREGIIWNATLASAPLFTVICCSAAG